MTEGAKIGLIIGASVVVLGGGGLAIYLSGRNKKVTPQTNPPQTNPPQTNQQVGETQDGSSKTFVDKAKNVADTAKTATETVEILGDIWDSVTGWFGKKEEKEEEKETEKPTGSLSDGTIIFIQKDSAIGGAYGQPTDKLYSNANSVNKEKKNLFKATAIDNSKRRMRINKLGIVEFV